MMMMILSPLQIQHYQTRKGIIMAQMVLLRRIKTDDDKKPKKVKNGEVKPFYKTDARSAVRNGRWEYANKPGKPVVEEKPFDGNKGDLFELTELKNSDKDVLKKICKDNKLAVSGNIEELAARIVEAGITKG